MIDAATQTVLIPGSVWSRETSNGPVDCTVLFITNAGLTPEVLLKNPRQVVFLSHKMEVLSMTIERFLKNRTYSTMNTDVETLVKAMTSPVDDEDDEDEIDIDSIVLPGDESGDDVSLDGNDTQTQAQGETFEATGALLATQASQFPSKTHVLSIDGLTPASLTLLQDRFVSYSESISPTSPGDTLHTLRFALSPQLGLDNLSDAFGLTGPITAFTINSAVAPTKVDIDCFVQVWLEVVNSLGGHPSISYGLVQVTSSGDIRSEQTVIQTPQPAAAPSTPPSSQNADDVPGDFVGHYKAPELEEDKDEPSLEAQGYKPGVSAFIIDAAKADPAPASTVAHTAPAQPEVFNLAAIPVEAPTAPAPGGFTITAAA